MVIARCSVASSPGPLRRRRKGLIHMTVCACSRYYSYCVYLPFDHYSSRGENGRIRRIDFRARFRDSCCHVDWWWDLLEQWWFVHLACVISQRSGGHSVFFTCVGPFHYYTRGKDSCINFTVVFMEIWCMHKQCVPGPFSSSSSKDLETRLGVQWNMSLNMSALRSACKNYSALAIQCTCL